MTEIKVKSYAAPEFCRSEILRYAGAARADQKLSELISECIAEATDALCYRVCYTELPLSISGDECDLSLFKVNSKNLAKSLSGAKSVIVFAATVGIGIDRLIAKYSVLSPARALIFQAIGAERIEALCELFSNDEICGVHTPRFSPGYGDLQVEVQTDIFKLLDAPRKIGLSLNGSMLMSPSKSVTAFIGKKE